MLQSNAAKEFSTAEDLLSSILAADQMLDEADNKEIALSLFASGSLGNQIDAISNILNFHTD